MSILNIARAKTERIILSRGFKSKKVSIPSIPSSWENFMDTEDKWVNVEFPREENASNALYVGREGSIFPDHSHPLSDEMLTVLNEGGEVKCVSETEVRTLKYGETIVFKAGEAHAVKFVKESKIFIHWHPHFEHGWDAEFLKQQQ